MTARGTADAWNAWEPLAREGKSSVDEAVPILEAHEKGGGNPAPYVRRAKHAVYERIRAHRGATRQAGDRQRGAWFAAVKALPDTVAGLRKLAALERAVRAAGGKGVAGSGRAA